MPTQPQRLPLSSITLETTPWVYETKTWRWDPPKVDHYILCIGIEGDVTLSHNDKPHRLSPWRAFILPPKTQNSGRHNSSQTHLVNFSARFSIPKTKGNQHLPFIVADLIEIDHCRNLIDGCMQVALDDTQLAVQQKELYVLQLLTMVWRADHQPAKLDNKERRIYAQVNRLRAGLDLFTTTQELADTAHLSRVHYSNTFKRLMQQSPNRFIIQCRIQKACILLRTTNETLESIAEQIGYSDVHFFARQFRTETKVTPNEFRATQANSFSSNPSSPLYRSRR